MLELSCLFPQPRSADLVCVQKLESVKYMLFLGTHIVYVVSYANTYFYCICIVTNINIGSGIVSLLQIPIKVGQVACIAAYRLDTGWKNIECYSDDDE